MLEREYKLETIRNIGIMAHIDAGKTTTTERMLYYTGKIYKIGEVDEGSTTMDWMEEEQKRGITITSAAITCYWRNHCINIIDTPGHVDFTAEVQRSLRILDGAIAIFCAVAGVQPQSETVWRQADMYSIPRIIFINKMDRIGADFFGALKTIHKNLTKEAIPVQIPIDQEENFKGVIDLIEMKSMIWGKDDLGVEFEIGEIPLSLLKKAKEYRTKLLEKIAENDEEIMEDYIHNKEISILKIKNALRKLTLSNTIVPVFCGAAFKNKGIQPLLDGILEYMPSPLDICAVEGIEPDTEIKQIRKVSDQEPFCALAFKVITDPYVGKIIFFRVYSGILKVGKEIYNSTKKIMERPSRILQMHAQKQYDREIIYTGEIGALVGLRKTLTGDTLCARNKPIILESIHFPEPVISVAIEPKSKKEEIKLEESLCKLVEEDPTFKVHMNKDTGQTIISGMGELHLEIIVNRLVSDFKVHANIGKPEVAYKETIRKNVRAEGKYIRQSGGKGQYGHVYIEIEPINEYFKFINKIKRGVIPQEYIPSVEEGIKEAMDGGILCGYPMINIGVTLLDGSFHEVDSSELAFKIAGSIAFTNAAQLASPILLEPMMKIEVITPIDYTGEIIGNINARRGKIKEMNLHKNFQIIKGEIPLAEMFGYATTLRSLSQGKATYNLEFKSYEEIPKHIAEGIIQRIKGV